MKVIIYIALILLSTCGPDKPIIPDKPPDIISEAKSIKDFESVNDWAKWLDINDTNIGVIDSIYDLKFKRLEFFNDLRLSGKGGFINLAPIHFHKSIYLDGISIDTVHDYWSNRYKYGVAFYYKGNSGKISVHLKDVKNSNSKTLIRVDNEQLKDTLFVDLDIRNITIKDNSNGGIHVRAVCDNGIVDNIKILKPKGYNKAILPVTDTLQRNAGNSYIDNRESSYYNSGLTIGSRVVSGLKTRYSENIKISNVYIENLVIGHDATTFNNDGGRSIHTTGVMFAGNNCTLINYNALNVERPLYLRGNNFTTSNLNFDNSEYTASYFFVNKGKRDLGLTKITNSIFTGKAEAAALISSTDSTVFEKIKFDITPTDNFYKLNDSLILRKGSKGFWNEGIFRDNGGSVIFKDVDININGKDDTYVFIGLNSSGLKGLYFENVKYSTDKTGYFLTAKKFKEVNINNLGIYGSQFVISETNKVEVKNVYPIKRNEKEYIFPIVYLTDVQDFRYEGKKINVVGSNLNRINITK